MSWYCSHSFDTKSSSSYLRCLDKSPGARHKLRPLQTPEHFDYCSVHIVDRVLKNARDKICVSLVWPSPRNLCGTSRAERCSWTLAFCAFCSLDAKQMSKIATILLTTAYVAAGIKHKFVEHSETS